MAELPLDVAAPLLPDSRPRRFRGWSMLAWFTLAIGLTVPGQTLGVAVFIDHFIDGLDLSRPAVSTAYLVCTVVGAVALLPIGRWIDRVGVSRAMLWIGLAFGGALMATSAVRGLVGLPALVRHGPHRRHPRARDESARRRVGGGTATALCQLRGLRLVSADPAGRRRRDGGRRPARGDGRPTRTALRYARAGIGRLTPVLQTARIDSSATRG